MTTDQLLAELEVKLSARRKRKMGDYKVVPMEPTDGMISVGSHALEVGAGSSVIYAHMLAAAPAVHGEPALVAWVLFDATADQKYIKMNDRDGSLAFFDSEAAAQRAKRMAPGTDYKRCEYYAAQKPAPNAPTFQLGDHVRKTKGSQWKGRVVGTYSTTLTPEGYAVESDTEKGSVQIYPVGALELVVEEAQPAIGAKFLEKEAWNDAFAQGFDAGFNSDERPAPDVSGLVEALEELVFEIESVTCIHDNTRRGGAIWEICEECGGKWSDDQGGKPEFSWPESVEKARALIADYRKGGDV